MPAALVLAPLPALSTEVCPNDACRHANSPREMCTCTACEDGAGHGIAYRVTARTAQVSVRTRIACTNDVFLGAAADDDDDELLARIVRRPVVLDDEEW